MECSFIFGVTNDAITVKNGKTAGNVGIGTDSIILQQHYKIVMNSSRKFKAHIPATTVDNRFEFI